MQVVWQNQNDKKAKTTDALEKWVCIPTAYTTIDNEVHHTHFLERNPEVYGDVFKQADIMALREQKDRDTLTPHEHLLIRLQAIQCAIDTCLRPDQEQAEQHMEQLHNKAAADNQQTTTSETIRAQEAEVCTMKSVIAKYYLDQHMPVWSTALIRESAYEGTDSWHMYLTIAAQGKTYTYHPNSPHNRLPHLLGISEEDALYLASLRDQQMKQAA